MSLENALLDPELTQGFAFLIIGVLSVMLYAGMKLYSTFVIASWSIAVIIFLGVSIYNLPILLFYFALISTAMLIALASIRYSQIT